MKYLTRAQKWILWIICVQFLIKLVGGCMSEIVTVGYVFMLYFLFPLVIGIIIRYIFDTRTRKTEKQKWKRFIYNIYPFNEINNDTWEHRGEISASLFIEFICGSLFVFICLVVLYLIWPSLFMFQNYTPVYIYAYLISVIIIGFLSYRYTKSFWTNHIRLNKPFKSKKESHEYYDRFGRIIGVISSFTYAIHYFMAKYLNYSISIILVPKNIFPFLRELWLTLIEYGFHLLAIYLVSILLSMVFIVIIYYHILAIYMHVKKIMISGYSEDFPFLRIKTFSDKIEGKVEEAFDKDFLTLDDKGIKKTVTWDRIEYVEIVEQRAEKYDNQRYLYDFV